MAKPENRKIMIGENPLQPEEALDRGLVEKI